MCVCVCVCVCVVSGCLVDLQMVEKAGLLATVAKLEEGVR